MSKLIAFVIAVFAVTSVNASGITSGKVIAEKLNHSLETELVVAYDGIPWGMAWLPSGDMLITMRGGELLLANKGANTVEKITGLPKIARGGQGGLLDIILHPNYSENGWLYFSYSKADGEGNKSTAIMRAKLKMSQKGSQLVDKEDIYVAKAYDDKRVHFGSRLAFDHQGYLYFSIGDRGHRDNNPQDISRDAGKVYRLYDDGRIPTDNPFAGKANSKQAIYSFGHRNPQGMATHPKTGAIWTHEHGPRGGDEVNIIAKGKNYGWPVISYGINYSGTRFTDITEKAGMEQPLWYWNPSIAPSGMTFVTSDKYPNWQGNLLIGSLKFGYLTMLTLQGNKIIGEAIVKDKLTRVRNVKQGPDGYIYAAVDGKGIFKLQAKR
ncbi:PQQ-dependent sugar dehydrogenase [Litorilituus sediminis]|uniref:PQQ-dependent sugar dehydrogenase n=1 Tax=Litorilituus sediminis TaxID=718192 RepID=A0A4P6P6S8_9GAMM|nr:PQQ-dependent sugar dehydrogenase [Litorilituus sediminis]QBG37331.1 PQQ-dependent sugar dehydrogenase [Litorilituus sediminis]